MTDDDKNTLATIRELHALGATHVRVRDVEVRFDRVFVPLKPVETSEPTLAVEIDGDEVMVSRKEVEALRDEVEFLRSFKSSAEALGVL